jgi:hypothetical protein
MVPTDARSRPTPSSTSMTNGPLYNGTIRDGQQREQDPRRAEGQQAIQGSSESRV